MQNKIFVFIIICFLPGDPEYIRTPFGLTNIPDPTIIPTIILKYYFFEFKIKKLNFHGRPSISKEFLKISFSKPIDTGILIILSLRF